jgi:hypothetical protein
VIRVRANERIFLLGSQLLRQVLSEGIGEEDTELQTYLELLIFSLAKAEDTNHDQKQIRRFYDQELFIWSIIMRSFAEEAEKQFEDE